MTSSRRPPGGRLVEAQQLADRVVEPVGAEHDDGDLDRVARLEHHEEAQGGDGERAPELREAPLGPRESRWRRLLASSVTSTCWR